MAKNGKKGGSLAAQHTFIHFLQSFPEDHQGQ